MAIGCTQFRVFWFTPLGSMGRHILELQDGYTAGCLFILVWSVLDGDEAGFG